MGFDPNKADTVLGIESDAQENLTNSNFVPPAQAQAQLKTARRTGVPPSQQNGTVVSSVDRTIPGPRTERFVAKSPAHAAAIQEDLGFFGVLENLAEGVKQANARAIESGRRTAVAVEQWALDKGLTRGTEAQARVAKLRSEAEANAQAAEESSYREMTSWEDFKKAPVSKFLPFAAEKLVTSAPQTAVSVASPLTGLAVYTGDLAQQRAKNNKKPEATMGDVLAAAPPALASQFLDFIGFKGMAGALMNETAVKAVKEVPKAAAKGALKEGVTEALQSGIENLTTNVGTDHGFHWNEFANEVAAGAVAGAGGGGMMRAHTAMAEAIISKKGVTPQTAEVAKIVAEDHQSKLEALQKVAERTPSILSDPDTVGEFFDDHDDEPDVLSIDPRGILEVWESGEQPFAHRAEEIQQALAEGGEIEIPLGEYLAATTGKAWADKLNEWTAPVGGYSSRALDELMELNEDVGIGENDPVLEAPEGGKQEALKQQIYELPEEQFQALNQLAESVWGKLDANAFMDSVSELLTFPESQQPEETPIAEMLKELGITLPSGKVAPASNIVAPAAEKQQAMSSLVEEGGWEALDELEYDEDMAAIMGVSPGAFLHETGKQFIEPEDLDLAEMDEIEQQQFQAQLIEAKDVLKKIVQEQFLTKLFKTPKAAGMTNAQFAMYSKKIEAAMEKLTQKLWRETYNSVKKQYTHDWHQAYQNHFQATMNEIMGSPEMVAEHALRFSQAVVDELAKTKIKGPDGKPAVLFHGADYSNIGTPENPWKAKGYDGISASYDSQFANNWKAGDNFNPFNDGPYSDHPYNEATGQGLTFYVLNFLAENPADFENKADVERVADWYLENGDTNYAFDHMSKKRWAHMTEAQKRSAMTEYGIDFGAPNAEEFFWKEVKAKLVQKLAEGNYRLWENKHMAKALGYDAVHMKENATSASKNVFVFDGKQVFFRYREAFEKRGFKIDVKAKALYPAELWQSLPNSMFSKDAGMMPDDLAGEFGFDNGEAMLKALTASQAARGDQNFRSYVTRKIKDTARLRTMQDVGDLLNPDKIHMVASALFSAPPVTDILIDQLRVLAEQSGQPFSEADIKAQAEAEFNAMPMRQAANIRAWERKMHVNGRQAEMNIEKDPITAFQAKQKQVLNHYKLIMAHNLQRLVARSEKHWQTWASHETMANTDQDYLNQIHNVLARLGYNVKRKPDELARSLGQSLEAFYNERQDFVYYDAPLWKKPQGMTVEEYTNLAGMLKSLGQAGRDQKIVTVNGQRVYLEALIERMQHDGRDLPPVPPDLNVGDEKPWWEKPGDFRGMFDAWQRKMENMVKFLDAENTLGVWHQVWLKPAHESANKLGKLTREVGQKVIDAYKKLPSELQDRYGLLMDDHPFSIIGPDGQPQKVKVYRKHMLSVILNLGNEYNARVLAEGYNTTEEAVMEWVLKHATKEEWDFAQEVGDIMTNELWPELDRVTRARRGIGLSRVEPRKVNGYKGWYFPVFHHPRLDNEAEKRAADLDTDPLNSMYEILGVPSGMTKARTGYTGPLFLDTDKVLFRHLENTYIFIAYGEYIQNALKWLKQSAVRNYVRSKLGQPYLEQFKPWLRDQVRSPTLSSTDDQMWNQIGLFFRGNWNKTVMLVNRSVMFSQIAGVLNSAGKLKGGGRQMAKGMLMYGDLMRKHKFDMPKLFHDMFERSEFLRERFEGALERDIWLTRQQIRSLPSHNKLLRTGKMANDWWNEMAAKSIGIMDAFFVAMPTWLAAYDEAKAMDYSDSDAVFYADMLVTSSQGSGRNIDMARQQRPQSEIMKMMTLASGYTSALYNQQIDMFRSFKQGRIAGGTAMAMYILVLGPIAARLITMDTPEEEKEPFGKWLFNATFFNLLAGIFVVRDAALYFGRKAEGEYAKLGSPVSSAIESVEKLWKMGEDLKDGEEIENPVKNTITSLGFLTGLPAGGVQVGRDLQFLADMLEGNVEFDNVNWAKALMSGKWEETANEDEAEDFEEEAEVEVEEEPEVEYVDE